MNDESREQAREAAKVAACDAWQEHHRFDVGTQLPGVVFGFDAGAIWQAEQRVSLRYLSELEEGADRLRAALQACVEALEDAGPCWDAGGNSRCYAHGGEEWPCPAADAITQARAVLEDRTLEMEREATNG